MGSWWFLVPASKAQRQRTTVTLTGLLGTQRVGAQPHRFFKTIDNTFEFYKKLRKNGTQSGIKLLATLENREEIISVDETKGDHCLGWYTRSR